MTESEFVVHVLANRTNAEILARLPALACATEGIDRFLMRNAMVGIKPNGPDFDVYAPHGFGDIAAKVVRPNKTANFQAARYREKAARWKALWPSLTVLSANDA